jgi:hypothetical protein
VVVVDGNRRPSKWARGAQKAFDRGIQAELAEFARRGVATVVMIDGRIVRGVPVKRGDRYVVEEAKPPKAS